MIEWMRVWLLSVIAMCVLCALAEGLMPSGPVRQVGRLVCGMSILLVLVSPLVRVDLGQGEQWLGGYFTELEQRKQELEQEVNGEMKVIIEREYAAYIVDKAAEMGLTCTARVDCRVEEGGLYIPERTEIRGVISDTQQSLMTQLIQEELGVDGEQQVYYQEEELP